MNENETLCPYCGAPVQQNAAFCLHCMKSLDEKTEIKKKKSAPKRLIAICAAALLVCAAAICAAVVFLNKEKEPALPASQEKPVLVTENESAPALICTADDFIVTAKAAAKKIGCEELWYPGELIETHYNKKENDSVYHTASAVSDAGVSVIFRNGGEVVDIALCDIKEADLESAYLISESAVSAALGYYVNEFAAMLHDKNAYPRLGYDYPFEEYFTEPLKRTDRYNALAASGDINTEFIQANTDGGKVLMCFFTERTDNGETLYDLYFEIQTE